MLVLNEIKTIENIETKISKVIKNVVNYNDYENHKDLLNFIENEAKKYNINLNDVFNKQSDSSRKILEKFKSNNDKRIKNFFKELLNKISIKFPQYYKNIKELLNNEKLENETEKFYTNFYKNLVKTKKEFKKELKELKEIGYSYYKRFKTEVGEINLDGINSKTVEYEFKEYTKLLSIMKNELLPVEERIKKLQQARSIIIGLSATFGISAGAFSIASLFCPALIPIATTFSVATAVCGIVAAWLQRSIHDLGLKVKKIIENIKMFEELQFTKFGIVDSLGLGISMLGAMQDLLSYKFPTKVWTGVSSAIYSFIGASFDIKSCIDSVEEMKNTIKNQKIIYKKTIEINNYLKNIEHIKWSVVDETKQTGPYNEGGVGGKNMKFKNLKTQEIFTLEELLSYSKIKLNLLGLTKVYNSKLKEWYIKTLPNKILIDNLG
ncbi:hypothetical protein [Metamycoplasma buccale]|uniref:hypothetical protein n=1 Tax=Metamycoplasma buccale TaxID=55602 RepID=UPI00398F35EF